MSLKCLDTEGSIDEIPESFTRDCPQLKGTYWFQAIRFHIGGSFLLTFSCENFSDTEPLQFEIKVIDESAIEQPESNESAETSGAAATSITSSTIQEGNEGKKSPRSNQQKDSSRGLPTIMPLPAINIDSSDIKEGNSSSTTKVDTKVKAATTPATVSKRKRSSHVSSPDNAITVETVPLDNSSLVDHTATTVKTLELDATKSTRSKTKSSKGTSKGDSAAKIIESEDTEENKQVDTETETETKRHRVFPNPIISFRNVQACPEPIIDIKFRLEPSPLVLAIATSPSSSSSSSQQNHCLPVHGPRLRASLPQSLVRALLADQVTHDKLCAFANHTNSHKNARR